MKIIISSFLIFIFLSNPSFAKWGKGDLKLDKETMETVIMYMYGAGNKKYSGNAKRKNNPTTMAISQNGKWSYYMYCPVEYHDGCVATNTARLIKACEKGSNGSPCFIFAKKRRIVWKNGGQKTTIKRKDLKDPYLVAKKIKEAGFYDGDISKLAGIDVKTGQIVDQTNIVEKKDTKKVVKKYELKGERSIALSWDGYENLIAGTVEFDEADYKGTLSLPLPNNDGSCDGSYSLQKGGKGTWQIACTNNMGAAGTLKWTETGGVTGRGRDHNDKKVKFTISNKS